MANKGGSKGGGYNTVPGSSPGGSFGNSFFGGLGNIGIPSAPARGTGKTRGAGFAPSLPSSGFNNNMYGGFQPMPQPAPRMPSLQQQYAGLNQGVMPFQPLGIRGYTPQPPPFYGGPVYGRDGLYGGGGFGGGGGFNPFGYNSFGGNPFMNQGLYNQPVQPQPQLPDIGGGMGDWFGGGFDDDYFGDFGDMGFERDYMNDRPVLPPINEPQFTKQVVEGGADRLIPITSPDFGEAVSQVEPDYSEIFKDLSPPAVTTPAPVSATQLADLETKANETQLALETATGPRTQGQFQAAKNAAQALEAATAFADSGGKTFAQEQAEAASDAARAKSLAMRPTAVADTLATPAMQQSLSPLSQAMPMNQMSLGSVGRKSNGGLVKGYNNGGAVIPTPDDLGITHPMLIDYPGKQERLEAQVRADREEGRMRFIDEVNKRARGIVDFNESGATQEKMDKNLLEELYGIGMHGFSNKDDALQKILDKVEKEILRRKGPSNSMERNLMQQEQLGFAEGGMPEENQTAERLEEETIMALMGKHPNPREVFIRYLEAYGEEGLMSLAAEVQQMMESKGRMVEGSGGGVDDAVPAMIDGVQPAALSKDEYVVPADVVAHAGDGSSEAGGRKFDELVSRVRKNKTGNTEQPEQIEFEEEITKVI